MISDYELEQWRHAILDIIMAKDRLIVTKERLREASERFSSLVFEAHNRGERITGLDDMFREVRMKHEDGEVSKNG